MKERANGMGSGRPMWTWLPFVAALAITAIVGLILLKVYLLQAERRQDAARAEVVSQLSVLRARLEISLTAPLLITRGLVAEIIYHGGIGDDDFVKMAAILLQDYPSIRNLTLARGTVISAVYPVAANRAVLGVDYRSRMDQWPSVERAITSRKAVVAGPVQLIQGGSALIGRVPVFLSRGAEPDFFGMISVVIDIPAVLAAAGLDQDRLGIDLAVRGRDGLGADGAMVWGPERIFAAAPVEMDVTLPDGMWRMAAIPKGGWDSGDGELRVTTAMGMVLFLMTAMASFGSALYVQAQRRARRHMAESEERYRALVETAPMAVVVHGDGIIQFANTEAARMVRAPPGESLVGRKVLDFVHPDSRASVAARVQELMMDAEGEAVLSGPVRYITWDGGSIETEVTSTRIGLGGTPAVLSVVHDVTLRNRAEAERERLLESLQRSNEDLQQFAYIASHDLQEPLRNVASYVQLLARRYSGRLDHDADEFIAYAVKGTKRMQEMITNLLDYSRLHEDDEREDQADCKVVLDEVLGDLSAAIEETGAVIEVGEMPVVSARPRELSRIFQNLIGNAIKYRRLDVIPRIRVSARREGRVWVFAIADNGIGLEPQYFERIFTLFQRLHSREAYDGTGIGLAICRKLVQHNGGRIWVESQPGQGSTFYFSMRAAD